MRKYGSPDLNKNGYNIKKNSLHFGILKTLVVLRALFVYLNNAVGYAFYFFGIHRINFARLQFFNSLDVQHNAYMTIN